MNLTKGKISKLYNKNKQSLRKAKKRRKHIHHQTFRRRPLNLANKTMRGGWPTTTGFYERVKQFLTQNRLMDIPNQIDLQREAEEAEENENAEQNPLHNNNGPIDRVAEEIHSVESKKREPFIRELEEEVKKDNTSNTWANWLLKKYNQLTKTNLVQNMDDMSETQASEEVESNEVISPDSNSIPESQIPTSKCGNIALEAMNCFAEMIADKIAERLPTVSGRLQNGFEAIRENANKLAVGSSTEKNLNDSTKKEANLINTNTDTNANTNTDTNANTNTDTNAHTNADTNANTNTDTNANTNAHTNAETNLPPIPSAPPISSSPPISGSNNPFDIFY